MRPVGAFLFGLMADRFGRRPTLMVDIIAYSVFELASAFAPSLKVFLIMRAFFGIAMGGEWGVGAALAFETLPAEGRGFFSGTAAGRLRRGVSDGGAGLRHAVSFRGLAGDVRDRCAAGVSGDLHSHQGGRIAGVAAGAGCARGRESPGQRRSVARRHLCFPGRADVRVQFVQSRDAGPLSDISAEESAVHAEDGELHRHRLQHWGAAGGNRVWDLVGEDWAAARRS